MDDEYNNNNNNDEDNDNDPLRSRCMQSSLPQHDSCFHNHDDHTTATIHNPTNYKDSSPFWQMISHPTIPYILVMETAERFAYYGFRAILVRYLMESLHYRESQAIAAYGYNSSASYLTPLLGAYAADVYFGNRFTTIWIFGLFYLLGLFLLTMATTLTTSATSSSSTSSSSHESDDNDPGWLLQQQRIWSGMGLLWICLGTGGIKPCVSSFGADQLLAPAVAERCDPSNTTTVLPEPHHHHSTTGSTTTTVTESSSSVDEAVRVYFNYFYFGINIGAIVSIAVVPTIRARTGSFTYAFGTSLVAVAGALALFWYRRHHYVILVQPPGNHQMTLFRDMYQLSMKYLQSLSWMRPLCIQRWRYRNHFHQRTHSHGSDGIHHDFDRDDTVVDNGSDENRHDDDDDNENDSPPMEDARQILHILPILATFPIYSCLYDQQGSVWTIQASHMYVPPYLQPEQMNMINPLLIMIFIPFFDQLIYPFLQNRCQISIAPLRLMSWGMFLTAMAFTCSGFVDSAIEYRHSHDPLERQVHVMWQLPQIILLAVGEIFLSVTGLEFAYSQSPIRCKAFVTALYLSTTGIGDLLAGVLYSTIFSNMKRATVMHVCAVMMLCNLRMFISVAHWYETSTVRPDSYIQVETSEKTAETDDIELTKVG